ncbi:lymphotoxin-beta [Pelodytes ibericus]
MDGFLVLKMHDKAGLAQLILVQESEEGSLKIRKKEGDPLNLIKRQSPYRQDLCKDSRESGESGKQRKGNEKKNWKQRNNSKAAAHLIGIDHTSDGRLKWEYSDYLSFARHVDYKDTEIVVTHDGVYYVYCQVGFQGSQANVKLSNEVTALHSMYRKGIVLMAGTESITGPPVGSTTWSASLSQGGLAKLTSGHRFNVTVSHPKLVDFREGKTFFGLVKVS